MHYIFLFNALFEVNKLLFISKNDGNQSSIKAFWYQFPFIFFRILIPNKYKNDAYSRKPD